MLLGMKKKPQIIRQKKKKLCLQNLIIKFFAKDSHMWVLL